jgi:hypothetical protein
LVASGTTVTDRMWENAERLTYQAIAGSLQSGSPLDKAVGSAVSGDMTARSQRDPVKGEAGWWEAMNASVADVGESLITSRMGARGGGQAYGESQNRLAQTAAEKEAARLAVTDEERAKAKADIEGRQRGTVGNVQNMIGVAKHLTGGAQGFSKMDAKGKDKVAKDMGVSVELLEDLVHLSTTGLADTAYEDLSIDQVGELEGISKALPPKAVRKKENDLLAKEIARQQAIREAKTALQGIFGEETIPTALLESIVDKGWMQSYNLVPGDETRKAAYLQESLVQTGVKSRGVAPEPGTPPFPDFISRPGREPLSFSSQDTLIGLKDGGPLAKAALGGSSGSSGSGKSVTINIYGSQAETYATVKRVLTEIGAV